jgi:hypothetical protein
LRLTLHLHTRQERVPTKVPTKRRKKFKIFDLLPSSVEFETFLHPSELQRCVHIFIGQKLWCLSRHHRLGRSELVTRVSALLGCAVLDIFGLLGTHLVNGEADGKEE